MQHRPLTPDDLARMPEPQQAHAVIVQLATACAVLANCLRDPRHHPTPFTVEDFMVGKAKRTEAYQAVNEWANKLADVPVVIEAVEKTEAA